MKNLDMSKIMKEAHKMTKEIKSEYPEVDYKFQLGLCMSFLMTKEEKITWETIEKAADKYVDENGYDANGWYTKWVANDWKKGAYDRTYIEVRNYRNGKLRNVKKCGFWDNIKEEYVAMDRYSEVLNLLA